MAQYWELMTFLSARDGSPGFRRRHPGLNDSPGRCASVLDASGAAERHWLLTVAVLCAGLCSDHGLFSPRRAKVAAQLFGEGALHQHQLLSLWGGPWAGFGPGTDSGDVCKVGVGGWGLKMGHFASNSLVRLSNLSYVAFKQEKAPNEEAKTSVFGRELLPPTGKCLCLAVSTWPLPGWVGGCGANRWMAAKHMSAFPARLSSHPLGFGLCSPRMGQESAVSDALFTVRDSSAL